MRNYISKTIPVVLLLLSGCFDTPLSERSTDTTEENTSSDGDADMDGDGDADTDADGDADSDGDGDAFRCTIIQQGYKGPLINTFIRYNYFINIFILSDIRQIL